MLVCALIFMALPYLFQAGMVVVREHSLAGPYTAGGEYLIYWDLTGSAQLGDGYIRLTTDEINKEGAIWNNLPTFPNNWELQMQFRIHGKGEFLNGDGMAVWYISGEDRLQHGPVFGSKDFFSGFGVFIDTLVNQAEPYKQHHPYISAMVNNGSLHYEHDEDGAFTQIGGCQAFVRNLAVPSKIAISYINNNLAVYLDNEGAGLWKMCFNAEGVYLPTGYYLGVSASTRDNSDNHDVISITFLNLDSENEEWIEKNDITPEAKNVQIPNKYHKDDLQKIKKREIDDNEGEEDEEEEEEEEEEETEMDGNEMKENKSEEVAPSTSLLRKLVYITGTILIILISISTFRKYIERRKERMHKRLY